MLSFGRMNPNLLRKCSPSSSNSYSGRTYVAPRLYSTTSTSPTASNNSTRLEIGEGEWRYLLFSDLHVSIKTLDRCLEVLRRIRQLYHQQGCDRVVFLGDFFHHRNVLNVRSVDALLNEFSDWESRKVRAVFIPGNHDQVDHDGMIHAVNLFSPFPNFTVATKPMIDPLHRTAFLPWRETQQVQTRLFTHLEAEAQVADPSTADHQGLIPLLNLDKSTEHQPPSSSPASSPTSSYSSSRRWTIFAHAEVSGALSNTGIHTKGKITAGKISSVVRSCYLGHFHKRQLLGDRIWYVGSPYEQNFGEAGDPKGVAIVDNRAIEPRFINFTDLPKHWSFKLEDLMKHPEPSLTQHVRTNDFVKIYATHKELISSKFSDATASLSHAFVTPVVLPSTTNQLQQDKSSSSSPSPSSQRNPSAHLSWTLEDIIERYTRQELLSQGKKVGGEGQPEEPVDENVVTRLVSEGRTLLAQVPDQQRHVVPLGKKTSLKSLEVEGFCGIRDNIKLDLRFDEEEEEGSKKSPQSEEREETKMVLLRGPMGVGKSSIFDALSWCLYGRTTPRRGGTEGASLRADEVINDDSDFACVSVVLDVDGNEITVERRKTKSKGAKLEVKWGGDEKSNPLAASLISIKDQQEVVNKVIGIDFALWRACVFLGQGEVTNFVSDTDKKRKEFLSTVFSLSAASHAEKIAKEKSRKLEEISSKFQREVIAFQSSYQSIEQMNFQSDIEEWETLRQKRRANTISQLEELKSQISTIRTVEQDEVKNLKSKRELVLKEVTGLEKDKESLIKKQRQVHSEVSMRLGTIRASVQQLERQIKNLESQTRKFQESSQCPTCGQSVDSQIKEKSVEKIGEEKEVALNQITKLKKEEQEASAKLNSNSVEQEANMKILNSKLLEKKNELGTIDSELEFSGTMMKLRQSEKKMQITLQEIEKEVNPFLEKQRQKEERLGTIREQLGNSEKQLKETREQLQTTDFWVEGFGSKRGLPLVVLREVLPMLQTFANHYIEELLHGKLHISMEMEGSGDDLRIRFFQFNPETRQSAERTFNQLSRGQQRCIELAFSPFALSDLIFRTMNVQIPFLVIDELTTHLDSETKPRVCSLLRKIESRNTVVVIDHDSSVQGEFDLAIDLSVQSGKLTPQRMTASSSSSSSSPPPHV